MILEKKAGLPIEIAYFQIGPGKWQEDEPEMSCCAPKTRKSLKNKGDMSK